MSASSKEVRDLADALEIDSMIPNHRFDASHDLDRVDFFAVSKVRSLIREVIGVIEMERDLYIDWHSKNISKSANLLRQFASYDEAFSLAAKHGMTIEYSSKRVLVHGDGLSVGIDLDDEVIYSTCIAIMKIAEQMQKKKEIK